MTRRLAVLRPEPAAGATVARIEALGLEALRLPLFEVHALPWDPPDPAEFDAVILTSANTVTFAGPGLQCFGALPVYAVGHATAAAAAAAGLRVAHRGGGGVAELLAEALAHGRRRLLHLGGRDRIAPDQTANVTTIAVYASEEREVPESALEALRCGVALLHSPRAARRLARLCDASLRCATGIAALSPAVLAAAGGGWYASVIAAEPADARLIAAARTLIDRPVRQGDKEA